MSKYRKKYQASFIRLSAWTIALFSIIFFILGCGRNHSPKLRSNFTTKALLSEIFAGCLIIWDGVKLSMLKASLINEWETRTISAWGEVK